ncbi:hypothetical protein [Trichocoleus sp. FACHB-46]|uniref:Uncharacterized protein n=1 Tax=Trichocoleus desertorum GB2-A4 TaxID=2933944 RepID=A0ABV0J635_9CYAN|nr:hypothetical protein [Trichocoleus sp. FACHB-46]
MTESVKDSVSANAAALLIHYSFDLNGYTADELVAAWTGIYQPLWIRSAVIEALYQGRYKGISVEQILALWLRRGQPLYHFNHEFERIVCSKFPQVLVPKPATAREIVALPPPKFPPQSHWRYLLPAAVIQTDNLSTAPVKVAATELPSIAISSPPLQNEGLNLASVAGEEQPDQVGATRLENASEPTVAASASNSSYAPMDAVAAEPISMALEPSIDESEVVAESNALSNPTLPLTSSSHLAEMAVESDMASDGALESVLEEADRLLSDLSITGSEASSSEMAQAGQAKPEPIHQFVPPPESSEFYSKLKAVAQPQENSLALSEPLSPSETKSQRV